LAHGRRRAPSAQNGWLARAGSFLEGRVTYELMEEFWPTADQDPAAPPPIVEFAQIWRDMPKVVYSRTLEQAGENATVVHQVVPAEVLALKAQPGGDLVLGGAQLGAEFARHDLIDEYRLYVHPHRDRTRQADAPAVGREGPIAADRDPHLRQRSRPPPLPAARLGPRRRVNLETARGAGVTAQTIIAYLGSSPGGRRS
jgi:dihydrofolate reductase